MSATANGKPGKTGVVSFRRMEDGTREDYELLDRAEREYVRSLPDHVLAALAKLDQSLPGYPVSRLGHSLQAATRALRDGADDELVVAALIHDGLFQTYYYAHHSGRDRHGRDKFRGHRWYQACVDFCANWDQCSFDPDYPSLPLSTFEPRLREIFSRPAHDPHYVGAG
jgi:predicted HD phosphohydrolase